MKFLSIALLAGAAVAQVSVIQDAITNIGQKTEALDSAINSFSGGDIGPLQSAATAVISAINTGNTNVQAISPVDSNDAFTLVGPIQTLAGQVNTAVNDLISKQSALSAESGVVHTNVQNIIDATNTFASTVYSKIPDSLVSTAQGLVAPILSDLNRALNAFPANGGSGPTSSTGPTSSSGSTVTSSSSGSTATPPSYSVSSTAASVAPTTLATSGTGSIVVPPATSISPPITSASSSPAPYNPNGASQLSGGFAAVVVAAAVAVAAF